MIKVCVVCGGEFDARSRNHRAKTCSQKCGSVSAKMYNLEAARKWRAENPERSRAYARQQYARDPKHAKEYQKKYRAVLKQSPHQWKAYCEKKTARSAKRNDAHAAERRALREFEAKLAQLAETGITL